MDLELDLEPELTPQEFTEDGQKWDWSWNQIGHPPP